jgi:hypothetical protein
MPSQLSVLQKVGHGEKWGCFHKPIVAMNETKLSIKR